MHACYHLFRYTEIQHFYSCLLGRCLSQRLADKFTATTYLLHSVMQRFTLAHVTLCLLVYAFSALHSQRAHHNHKRHSIQRNLDPHQRQIRERRERARRHDGRVPRAQMPCERRDEQKVARRTGRSGQKTSESDCRRQQDSLW